MMRKRTVDNWLNKKVKIYCKNRYEIQKYYNISKLLLKVDNDCVEGIIKE